MNLIDSPPMHLYTGSKLFLVNVLLGMLLSCSAPSQEETATRKAPGMNAQRLLGIWTDGSTENATFEMGVDSVYYVEQFTAYPYSIHGDSIHISYPDFALDGALRFSGDTMIITAGEEATKYWRFRD